MRSVAADLPGVFRHAEAVVEKYEGFQAGGGGMVAREAVKQKDVTSELVEDKLQINFEKPDASFEATSEAWNLPGAWKGYDKLRVEVELKGGPATVSLLVVGARCLLADREEMAGDRSDAIVVDLRDLPLTAGIRSMYEPTGIRLQANWEGGEATRTVIVSKLELIADGSNEGKFVVDKFGQRASKNWPGKVKKVEDMLEHRDREAEVLARTVPPADRDEYGGWTGHKSHGLSFNATGFFHVEQDDNDRWWLIDPAGNPFWSMGTTGVRLSDSTPCEGREDIYETLPGAETEGKEGEASGGAGFVKYEKHVRSGLKPMNEGGVVYYAWNVMRKYGSIEAWRDRVIDRFKKWGFNTVANWSCPEMLDQQQLPHVRTVNTRTPTNDEFRMIGKQPDVFDPNWEKAVNERMAELVPPSKDNPWLIGWFTDNEWPWSNLKLLDAAADSPVREVWVEVAREQFKDDIKAFNTAFESQCADWADVAKMTMDDVPESAKGRDREGAAGEAMSALDGRYADKYFSTVNTYFRQYDSNHMYLGCRFTQNPVHPLISGACGRVVDAMTVNCYSWEPDAERFGYWHECAGGKPIMIGEHHTPLDSPRQLPPLYPNFTEQQRHEYYIGYHKALASMKFGLGCHWFQHADQPLTGRGQDGECQTIGFVDITDQPHAELVNAARYVADHVYQWHLDS